MAEVNRPSPLRKVNYREKQDIYVLNLTWFHCQTYFGVVSCNIVINFTCTRACMQRLFLATKEKVGRDRKR